MSRLFFNNLAIIYYHYDPVKKYKAGKGSDRYRLIIFIMIKTDALNINLNTKFM
jgi:hypothetical protein